ncbi:MAG: hypothetical protein HUU55_19200 [Myxococcales bacterium]|nr:hypothetical protein [Myxococcales bacterium]
MLKTFGKVLLVLGLVAPLPLYAQGSDEEPLLGAPEPVLQQPSPDATQQGTGEGDTLFVGEEPIRIEDGTAIDVIVDESGGIYKRRRYGGIIPQIRDQFTGGLKSSKRKWPRPTVTWVGFQQHSLFSRVFVQRDRQTSYTIYKSDPQHIYIDIPDGAIPIENDRRELLTTNFEGAVASIAARSVKTKTFKGARVIVKLKRAAGFLYKDDGNYIFIDIER